VNGHSGRHTELGESLQEGVARELLEETGIEVRVLGTDRVFEPDLLEDGRSGEWTKARFHFVIAIIFANASAASHMREM